MSTANLTDTLNAIENDPNLLKRIMTGDESWFLADDPEANANPCSGRAQLHRGPKNLE